MLVGGTLEFVLGQRLQVTKKPHPSGEAGVFHSLEQVAKKVAQGSTHPKVRAWAIEQLDRARKLHGIPCDSDRQRAQVLLRAVQKKLWVPDPVHSEYMVGAHLMACDRSTKDEICFLSGDCDDLVVLLGSCFLSVGLNAMVVGHAYDSSKHISHVLTSVRVDGRWMYADPTPTDFKLGECVEFTRERILSVPNIQVLCDEDACLIDKRSFDPDTNDFVTEGHFVGVDGVPKLAWLRKRQTLGQTLEERGQAVMDACLDATLRVDVSTAAARERAFGNGARCAADAYCATFAVPPGICSTIVGPVADAIANLWSSIFGSDPSIDCSKVSTFDPCHDCKLLTECLRLNPVPAGFPNFQEQQARTARIQACMNQRRRACYEAERKRIAAATLAVAQRTAAEAQKKETARNATLAVGAGAAAGAALWYFLLR